MDFMPNASHMCVLLYPILHCITDSAYTCIQELVTINFITYFELVKLLSNIIFTLQ